MTCLPLGTFSVASISLNMNDAFGGNLNVRVVLQDTNMKSPLIISEARVLNFSDLLCANAQNQSGVLKGDYHVLIKGIINLALDSHYFERFLRHLGDGHLDDRETMSEYSQLAICAATLSYVYLRSALAGEILYFHVIDRCQILKLISGTQIQHLAAPRVKCNNLVSLVCRVSLHRVWV